MLILHDLPVLIPRLGNLINKAAQKELNQLSMPGPGLVVVIPSWSDGNLINNISQKLLQQLLLQVCPIKVICNLRTLTIKINAQHSTCCTGHVRKSAQNI